MLPLGTFGDREKKILDGFLSRYNAWGATPLYLSVEEGIKKLEAAPDEQSKRLIVITDGLQDPPIGLAGPFPHSLAIAAKAASVSIDIIGIDLPQSLADQADLRTIVGPAGHIRNFESKGKADAQALAQVLVSQLQQALGLSTFEVRRLANNELIGRRELGLPCPFRVDSAEAFQIASNLEGVKPADCLLVGGEALELILQKPSAVGPQAGIPYLEFKPYDQDVREQAEVETLLSGGKPASLRITTHLPRREMGKVEFPVSFQNLDVTKCTLRPAEIWATITPQRGNTAEGQPFYFCDAIFQQDRRSPVLSLKTSTWPPKDAAGHEMNASLDLFFKFTKTPWDGRWIVGDVLGDKEVAIDKAPNTKFTIRRVAEKPYEIIVEEHFAGPGPEAKVEMSLMPQRIRRRRTTQGMTHYFEYDRSAADLVLQYAVLVTSLDSLRQDATKLRQPITVIVPPAAQ